MENSTFILCKQEGVTIERLHICTWDLGGKKYFTEYGLEINRSVLKKLSISIVLPEKITRDDIKCLAQNVSDTNNCRFLFNSDIENSTPINGNPAFGVNISLCRDRKLSILPIENCIKLSKDKQCLQLDLDIPDQAYSTIYFRFLIKSKKSSFSFEKKEISKKIINYDIRINECRTAPQGVNTLQRKGYYVVPIRKCFCFHIIPNTYNIDFVNSSKLKTVRGLELVSFDKYLGDTIKNEKISLKEDAYNIVFCKQENQPNYSFFSTYSKDYIGDIQIILALSANILCSLLFAAGGLHSKVLDFTMPYWKRIPVEYWIAFAILVALLLCFFVFKRRK